MAKTTVTKLGNSGNNADRLQLGGVADGYTGSEFYIRQAAVQTTDATATTIASVALAETQATTIQGIITGLRSDHSEGIGGTFSATFRRDGGGNVTLIGTVDTSVKEDSSGSPTFTLDADTSTQTARIRVTGEAAKTFNWVVSYMYHIVSSNS